MITYDKHPFSQKLDALEKASKNISAIMNGLYDRYQNGQDYFNGMTIHEYRRKADRILKKIEIEYNSILYYSDTIHLN